MKFLIIGLGSMGKRRIRNLLANGISICNIVGMDLREDRANEAEAKYKIKAFSSYIDSTKLYKPDVLIVSTPPKNHMEYAWQAAKNGIHCFIEASVVDAELIRKLHNFSLSLELIIVPSCTMRYFPGPKKVKQLINAGVIGEPLNINYHTGQYIKDWHPWEKVEDFYVSDRETSGCREIVPFELTWLNDIFGFPKPISCVKSKLDDIQMDVEDIYHCVLQYPNGILLNMTIEVISRPKATRELLILGKKGKLVFSADEQVVRYINYSEHKWKKFKIAEGLQEGNCINPEEPYIEEIGDFLAAIKNKNKSLFPNNLLEDYNTLQLLYELENIAAQGKNT